MSKPTSPKFCVPGTPEATAAGCTCQPKGVVKKSPRSCMWAVAPDCPIHQGDPEKIAKSRQEIAEGKYWTFEDGVWTPGPGIEPGQPGSP